MAGAEGFEPPNAGTKNQCLTTWRRPIEILLRGICCEQSCIVAILKLWRKRQELAIL